MVIFHSYVNVYQRVIGRYGMDDRLNDAIPRQSSAWRIVRLPRGMRHWTALGCFFVGERMMGHLPSGYLT